MEEFFQSEIGILIIIILVVWSVIWKGLALWESAKKNEFRWFLFFLLVNTAGIAEIIYLNRKKK